CSARSLRANQRAKRNGPAIEMNRCGRAQASGEPCGDAAQLGAAAALAQEVEAWILGKTNASLGSRRLLQQPRSHLAAAPKRRRRRKRPTRPEWPSPRSSSATRRFTTNGSARSTVT